MTSTEAHALPDEVAEEAQAFAQHLFGCLNASALPLLVDVAHRVGLLEAAAQGPGTSEELARRASLSERHVRELLDGLTTAGVFTYEPAERRYTLPASRAVCLTGDGPMNFAPATTALGFFGQYVEPVAQTVRDGGGIPYDRYRPAFTSLMDASMRRVYDALLVDGYVPSVPGLAERLEAGCRVADLGCGTGHVVNLLAAAFPRSTFTGYDLATDALERARAEAASNHLENAHFEQLDVADLAGEGPFDVVCAFDAIHDQVDPAAVLRAAHDALQPDGVFVMVDVHLSSDVADNASHPLGAWMYTTSLFHCMQVSLAEGGVGLGTCWGWQQATRMLEDAGFADVTVIAAPAGDPMNAIFTGRPA